MLLLDYDKIPPDLLEYFEPVKTDNAKDVFSIATKPYKEAHFAVMPEKLVEPCILAGCPPRVCADCGAPWVRVVEREDKGFADRTFRSPHDVRTKGMTNGRGKTTLSKIIDRTTIAFTPTCSCDAPHRPGVVLDPFFGAGTVGVVAKKLKRNWLGIELNPEYAEMARRRINQTQGALFAL